MSGKAECPPFPSTLYEAGWKEYLYDVRDQLIRAKEYNGDESDKLGKGERQRVMLLVVLLRCPRLILADEPLEGLDRESRSIIGRALVDYTRKDGQSVLWVSHHLAETLQYADRLLEIEECRLVERHSSRFEFRLSPADVTSKSVRAPSLLALPAFVEQCLHTADSVRFEVTD